MRTEYKRAVKNEFACGLKQCAADFVETKVKSDYCFGGRDIVFVNKPAVTNLLLFIILVFEEKREAFTMEVGWSTLARFPELSPRPSGRPTPDRAEFSKTEFVCRLTQFFVSKENAWIVERDFDPSSDDFLEWVKGNDEHKCTPADVTAPVQDCLAKLEQFGIPYLNEYLGSRRS